jgi:hypothetical protein
MRFHAEHRFAAPVGAVVGLLVDPDFHRQLELPDVELMEVVDSRTDGDQSRLRLRYRFVGHLDPIGKRLLGGRDLTWLQELQLDRTTGAGSLSFHADTAPERLHGAADFTNRRKSSDSDG